MDDRIKVYLAGPDVFRENAENHFIKTTELCEKYRVSALVPYDSKMQKSDDIYLYNKNLIQECHIVVANLEPFRGVSVDVGTAFEIGYAKALGKPVVGYSSQYNTQYKDRLLDIELGEYPKVENFGLYDNLMIAHSCDFLYRNLESALSSIASLYGFLKNG